MRSVLGDRRAIAVLLGPALLLYTLVMLVPMGWSLGYTFFTGNVIEGFSFDGLGNFTKLWQDPQARSALRVTLEYGAAVTVAQVLCGYLLALLYVFVLRKSSAFVRTLVFFPVILPTVAVALMFQKLFAIAPQKGLAGIAFEALGLHHGDWFASGAGAFFVIVLMDVWRSMGFYGVLIYAGLLDIPEETLESARLDGATGWRLIRHIVLPLSWPVVLSSLVFSINGTLKVFDSVLALTNGGPGSDTTPLTLYMFRTAFSYGDYGYGSTIALLLTVVCLGVTLLIFRFSRRDPTKG
ncbi:carbohydrate ABC transporter permease [Streptacidiphilus carbonis]|jgi:raffinose/stachyose/melibiose transport system permease protein|uniref:carbohydrate ABC transporter permease n=1 Tax=Streptacidiphilus carbonis TaxID=105422 RepID=UPI0005A68A69|nr:sugar ABC transporter permease [Streptacidiphilus carbonis]